jgi:hypothetical protein
VVEDRAHHPVLDAADRFAIEAGAFGELVLGEVLVTPFGSQELPDLESAAEDAVGDRVHPSTLE